jgi:hypothetical protein
MRALPEKETGKKHNSLKKISAEFSFYLKRKFLIVI